MEATLTIPTPDALSLQIRLSFRPFVAYLKAQRDKTPPHGSIRGLYTYLIDQLDRLPVHINYADNDMKTGRLKDIFQLTSIAVLPLAASNQPTRYAFGLPMPLTILDQSAAFRQVMDESPDPLADMKARISSEDKLRYAYQLILEKCYNVSISKSAIPLFQFQKQLHGLTTYYRLDINASFVDPHISTTLPPLQTAWIQFANGTRSLPDGVPKLSIADFSFEGFVFFTIEDITETQTIQQLQAVFTRLQSDTEPAIYRQFETALWNLCGQPDLQISVVPIPKVNGRFVTYPGSKARSVFMRNVPTNRAENDDAEVQFVARRLSENPKPYVFADLRGLPEAEHQLLYRQGIRSFLVYPILSANEPVGLLEMGSPYANAFSDDMLATIDRVVPLVQELLRYQLNQFTNKLEQLIKKEFTPLQPAVEWKFYEAALDLLNHQAQPNVDGPLKPVAFPNLYPFYGAVDVRDSSVARQEAVQRDLLRQVVAAETLFARIHSAGDPDRLASLRRQCQYWQMKLDTELQTDNEIDMGEFLAKAVSPYVRRLAQEQPDLAIPVEAYLDQTDPQTGQYTQSIRDYEQSLARINTAVNQYIEQEEKVLQTIYPHYFERYRTDGMEYTLYAGQSIAPGQSFGPDHRRQLAEWHLTTMVALAQLTNQLLPGLPLPLQTTQLLLLHTQPVDISFRRDERRFDVEGSASVHYEVIKKRIDKAHVSWTQERLTQPGTIALVFADSADLTDYKPIITQLQRAGSLQPGVEYFDVEPLQGVASLKALRLNLNYPR